MPSKFYELFAAEKKEDDMQEQKFAGYVQYECPISGQLMLDPVLLTADGRTYEREKIEEWLQKNKISPFTRADATNAQLIENRILKDIIDTFIKEHPEYHHNRYFSEKKRIEFLDAWKNKDIVKFKQLCSREDSRLITDAKFEEKTFIQYLLCQDFDNFTFDEKMLEALFELATQHKCMPSLKDRMKAAIDLVQDGDISTLKQVIQLKLMNVDDRDEYGNTLLHHAAAEGESEIIKFLIFQGSNTSLTNHRGQKAKERATTDETKAAIRLAKKNYLTEPLENEISELKKHNASLEKRLSSTGYFLEKLGLPQREDITLVYRNGKGVGGQICTSTDKANITREMTYTRMDVYFDTDPSETPLVLSPRRK